MVLLRPVQVMIGSDRPIPIDEAGLDALLRRPEVVAHARRGNTAAGDLTRLVAGGIERWDPARPRNGTVLTDMFPQDEFFLNHTHLDSWRARDAVR